MIKKPNFLSVSYIDYLGGEQTGVIVAYETGNDSIVRYDPDSNLAIIGDDVLVFIKDVKEELNTEVVTLVDGSTLFYAECRRFGDVILN